MSYFSFRAWLRKISGRVFRRPIRYGRRGPNRGFRPLLEMLEDRLVPATLLVNSFADNITDTGHLTLRDAITLVNNAGNPASLGQSSMPSGWASQISGTFGTNDTIQFDSSLSGQTIILGGTELPQITENVTIAGLGARSLAISGNSASGVFDVSSSAIVTMSGLTIEDGSAGSSNGGGIVNSGTLMLTGSIVSGNTAAKGAGVDDNAGTLILTDTTVSDNTDSVAGGGIFISGGGSATLTYSNVSGNQGGRGGGIADYDTITTGGTLTITGSSISNNTGPSNGGGIYSSGNLTLTYVTISDNSGAVGGGINVTGPSTIAVSITNTTITDNTGNTGVGIFSEATLHLVDSTVSGNLTTGHGSGGGIYNSGVLYVTDSTVSGNQAFYFGGGIDNNGGPNTATILDSTIANNKASYGGGVSSSGPLTITDSTVSGNTATTFAGGVYINSGTFTLENSIVAANTAPAHPDIKGTISSDAGYNLLGTALSTSEAGHNNVFSDAPLLASLGNYGGPTQTMLPLPGSPAIGAGNNTSGPFTDQRGFARSTGVGGDIGADEGTLFIVSTTTDNVAGSLRTDITAANSAPGASVIQFAGGLSGTITLDGTELPQIASNLQIDGPGASDLAISGNNLSRVFDIASGATVAVSFLNIENGTAPASGNFYGLSGGAIRNDGTLTLTDSTVADSYADYGGGISNFGTLKLIDSTLSGNTSDAYGGGLVNYTNSAQATLIDSTVSGNSIVGSHSYDRGGGIYNSSVYAHSQLTLENTIVAGNSAFNGPDIHGAITTDNGHNLLGTALSGTTDGTGDVFSDTPMLAPLGYYGGPTETMPLLPGSPAIGVGNPTSPDQRSFGPDPAGSGDIGAFQTQPAPLIVNSADDTATGAEPAGELSLRDAINLANVLAPAGGANTITFDSSLSGATITLAGSALPQITADVTITGLGANHLAVSGNGQSRVLDIASGATAIISGLTIEDGSAAGTVGQNGGAIYNQGTLTLTGSIVSGSSARYGGGISNINARLTLVDSTISTNTAYNGAGFYNNGTLTLNNSTVYGNSASNRAGAIDNTGTLTLTDSTVSGNSASVGDGGILKFDLSTASLTLQNTIVSGNTVNGSADDIDGTINHDYGYNLLGAALRGTTTGHGDIFTNIPLLAALGYYGGPSLVMPLLPGGPAIGAGDPSQAGTLDQRGVSRVSGSVDIGAVEDARYTVANTNDSGNGSLRYAISAANSSTTGPTVILFDSSLSGDTIILGGTELPRISADVQMVGLGAGQLAVSANNQSRVFDIASGATVRISGLTVEYGFNNDSLPGGSGGGILSDGTLSLANDMITGNYARYDGGGIASSGTLTLTDSTVTGNRANHGAGLYDLGTMDVTDSTIADNSAGSLGGGIYANGTLTLTDSTVTGNSATNNGGGIANYGVLTLDSSIASANSSPTDNDITAGGGIVDQGHNLLGTALTPGPTDVSSNQPDLSSLGYYGGPTQTIALLSGSPAIGAGDPSQTGTLDQRGFTRGSSVDSGAFQTQSAPLMVNSADDTATGAAPTGELSLRDAINLANVLAPVGGAHTVTFDSSLSGATITLAGSELPLLTANVTITGLGAAKLAVNGILQSPVFDIGSGTTVNISGLKIENGYTGSGYGGGITNAGTLTLTDSTLTGNHAFSGGAIYNALSGIATLNDTTVSNNVDPSFSPHGGGIDNKGTLYLINQSIVSGNYSSGNGGGIYNSGTLTVTDSTVSGNTAAVSGGGIGNSGTLTVTDSTISGNQANGTGSGNGGGGIANLGGTASLTDSTVASNSAYNYGGGVLNNGGSVTITDSTISANNLTGPQAQGGGIDIPSGTLTLQDSIVAGNTNPTGVGPDLYNFYNYYSPNTINDNGNNLIGDPTDANITFNGSDLVGGTGSYPLPLESMLAPLGYYGGPTETMALLPGSPAIGAGAAVPGITTDQRGVSRGSSVDIGAFQTQSAIVVNTTDDTAAGGEPFGELSLRAAVSLTNAGVGGTIAFNIPTSDSGYNPSLKSFTIQLSSTLPTISGTFTIDGTTEWAYLQSNYAITVSTPDIVLDGSNAGTSVNGLYIEAGNSTVKGLVIDNFGGAAIDLAFSGATDDVIEGNYIGTDVTGTSARANLYGVFIYGGASNNIIGGTTAGTANVISGNTNIGVNITDAATTGNVVEGNRIGTDATGTVALGNGYGIGIVNGASGNTIGGTATGSGNVISGNTGDGVQLSGPGDPVLTEFTVPTTNSDPGLITVGPDGNLWFNES